MQYTNRVQSLLERNETVFGATTTTLSPTMIDVYGDIGLDFVWLDYEHIGHPTTHGPHFEMVRRASEAAGIEPVVRVESPEASAVRKVVDAGIRTFVVPRVTDAQQVRSVIEASRFRYEGSGGDRGIGTCFASRWGNHPSSYIEDEDDTTMPGIMMETTEALDNIDEILSVPELGFVHVGPSDLSASLGHPLERDHPAVKGAIQTVIDAGEEHGVPVSVSAGHVGGVEHALREGFCIIKLGSEVSSARELIGERFEEGVQKSNADRQR